MYDGYVEAITMTFNTADTTAVSRFTLSNVRRHSEIAAENNCLESHPFYDAKPFIVAPWIGDPHAETYKGAGKHYYQF
jgi:hypothetical protein